MTDRWFVDGVESGTVPPDDRGLTCADGLFETIAVRGGQARFIDYHVRRLDEGTRRLGLPIDMSSITQDIDSAAAAAANGTLRLTLTRGSGPRGYAPPTRPTPRRILLVSTAPAMVVDAADWPVDVLTCLTPAACSPATAGLKTIGALDRVLASREVVDAGVDEGLMLDPEGLVVGGTRTNVFLVSEGRVVTPGIRQSGVRGVMRSVVMDVGRTLGIGVTEAPCTPGMLREAAEVFVSNALMGIRPVRRLDGRILPTGALTVHIARALRSRGVTECPA